MSKPWLNFASMKEHRIRIEKPFELECGEILPELEIHYHYTGELNENNSNVIWVCHALTANSDVEAWWPGMVGSGLAFDTDRYFILCANILGSCYGSTGPVSLNPHTGAKYGKEFPMVTVKDMVNAHQLLCDYLEIQQIQLITGGSLGGQQALEWAVVNPDLFAHLVPIATNAIASPWGIAFNESQRMAIQADPGFQAGQFSYPSAGLRAARSIALLSYRNAQTYNKTQAETSKDKLQDFKACSYQQYQGEKLDKRFDHFSYYTLTKALDSQNLGRGRKSLESALIQIEVKTMVIGISSDLLFPVHEQRFIAKHIPGASLIEIDSFYGHDGFLLEVDQLTKAITNFLN